MGKTEAGSFAVEAAFLFPIFVLVISFLLHTAIGLYEETERSAKEIAALRQIDAVEWFRAGSQMESLGELLEQKLLSGSGRIWNGGAQKDED